MVMTPDDNRNSVRNDVLDMELPGDSPPKGVSRSGGQSSSKKIPFVLAALLLVLCMGAGGWWFFLRTNTTTQQENELEANEIIEAEEQVADTSANDVPSNPSIEEYKASHPRVSFKHPTTWTVEEGGVGDGVRIVSPEFTYPLLDGAEVTGHFRIYMRQGARKDSDSTYIGRGVATKATETLTYREPAADQRETTALSFMGLDTADNFAYFFITSDYVLKVGDTLGPDYGTEPSTYIIVGGYSTADLTDDLAMNQVSLDYYETTEVYKQAIDILESLQVM